MRKVHLGLIGLGSMGKIHLHNCLRLKNAELISVADSSRKELEFAEKAGVKNTQEDYDKLLNDPNIEAVIVSVPNFLHCECAVRAAEAGKDIFLEKPLARNVAEGEEILSCVKRAGVKLMAGYPSRFNEPLTRLRDMLQDGVFGDIQVAVGTNISTGPFSPRGEMSRPAPVPDWWFDKELTGGGALLDLGTHLINLFRWYFGEVSGAESFLGSRFNMDFEDYAVCFLKFKDGPTATLNVGWFSKESHVSVELYGTVRHVCVVHRYPRALGIIADDFRRKLGKTEKSLERYYKELQYFVECVNSDTQPVPSGEEGLLDLRTLSMAYENSFHLDS